MVRRGGQPIARLRGRAAWRDRVIGQRGVIAWQGSMACAPTRPHLKDLAYCVRNLGANTVAREDGHAVLLAGLRCSRGSGHAAHRCSAGGLTRCGCCGQTPQPAQYAASRTGMRAAWVAMEYAARMLGWVGSKGGAQLTD